MCWKWKTERSNWANPSSNPQPRLRRNGLHHVHFNLTTIVHWPGLGKKAYYLSRHPCLEENPTEGEDYVNLMYLARPYPLLIYKKLNYSLKDIAGQKTHVIDQHYKSRILIQWATYTGWFNQKYKLLDWIKIVDQIGFLSPIHHFKDNLKRNWVVRIYFLFFINMTSIFFN